MNYLRFLCGEGDKVTCGSRVEVGMQDPCHSVTSFLVWKWCGSRFLSGGQGFAPPILPRGSHVEVKMLMNTRIFHVER